MVAGQDEGEWVGGTLSSDTCVLAKTLNLSCLKITNKHLLLNFNFKSMSPKDDEYLWHTFIDFKHVLITSPPVN